MNALATGATPDTSLLVYAAMLCYAGGLVFRRQVILRLFLLAGSGFYILYYYFHPAEPLWDAMLASGVIASATLLGLLRILCDGLPALVRPRDRSLLAAFDELMPGALTPGQLRRLMRSAHIETSAERRRLLELGRAPSGLFFVQRGEVEFHKAGGASVLEGPRFVGDAAFVTGGMACEDAWVREGAVVVRWPAAVLRRQIGRDPALASALHALLTRDMAAKIVRSVEMPRTPVAANESVPNTPMPNAFVPALRPAARRRTEPVPAVRAL